MADKATTPPPAATTSAENSSPLTSNPKRARMSSPEEKPVGKIEKETSEEIAQKKTESTGSAEARGAQSSGTATAPAAATDLAEEEEEEVEVDDGYSDSGLGTDHSDTTSIASSIYQGHMENGRRYQTTREGEYWGPSDEKQFDSMEASHLVHLILDSKNKNKLFYSPVPDTAQHILDVGCGTGAWARDVADKYPGAVVQGIDLYPPPNTWVPPNCKLEVDDALKPWMYQHKFDLIHLRYMFGSFTDKQWKGVYKQAYENLIPGGWIEEVEVDINNRCDDGSMPKDSLLAQWGPTFIPISRKIGKDLDSVDHFKSRIEAAGFINVHEKVYKVPFGEWPKDPVLKEAGKFHKTQIMEGMEGYVMFFLTHFGDPEPWQPEEVQVYLANVRNEIAKRWHSYHIMRRVWAQKPYETKEKVKPKAEVENVQ